METGYIPQKGLPSRVHEYIKHTYIHMYIHTHTHTDTRLRPVRRGKGGKTRAYVEDSLDARTWCVSVYSYAAGSGWD